MINYDTIPNTTGSFPDVESVNASSPGAVDGTPYYKPFIDDLWGARQALMDQANLTPDAIAESAAVGSQVYQAMYRCFGSPGEIVAWGSTQDPDPSTQGIRMLPLNGQGVLAADYLNLDFFTYVGAADNPTAPAFYHADDAAGTSRNASGIYLILPDMRGYALRGLDSGASVDPDGATREIGDAQDWSIADHEHYVWDGSSRYSNTAFFNVTAGGTTFYMAEFSVGSEDLSDLFADSIPTFSVPAANQSSESRMTNSAVHWCVRY